ncbi:MAG TPA: TetR/AcrR family transcriptional regulator [Actinopolymorphaceae bacterium]
MTTQAYSGSGDPRRSLELLWHGQEPGSRGPRRGLSLRRIVTAAVRLADREGLAALSMRNVAAELGVGTMSLYRYVPGKGELLDLMLDHVVRPVDELAEHRGKDWRTVLGVWARDMWRLYVEHPWLLQVNQERQIIGPNALGTFEFTLAGLDNLGLDGKEKTAIIGAIGNYVTGAARTHVLHLEACRASGMSDEEFWAIQEPFLCRAMETGAYPQLAKLPEESFTIDAEEAFQFGLELMLDGLEKFLEERRRRER